MKNRKKIFILSILLLILIILCIVILKFDNTTYKINVDGKSMTIEERHYNDSCYITIDSGDKIYPFRVYDNFNRNKLVSKIYFYVDSSIECVLPIINDKVYVDMMCYKEDILYDYNSIIGENKDLDDYINTIKQYDLSKFKNENIHYENIGTVKYNLYDEFNKISALSTYNGLVINGREVKIFEKDVYSNKISTFVNNYYIIADYEKNYSFNYFYIVNLYTKEISKLKSRNEISYDSYIQGIVDNKVYLYDKDNEVQYEIDVETSKINIISSNNYIKYYNNKKWEKISKLKANKEVYFNYDTLDNIFTDYDYVKETNNYYYLFKKNGISYKLYRVDKNNIDVYKYILETPVTSIVFKDNFLYYVYKNKLYYYSDNDGLKVIYENAELEFNDTIKYYVY